MKKFDKDGGQTTYENIEDLIEVVVEKWNSMSIEYQTSLIDHHMKVLKQVYEAEGQYVK